MTELAASGQHLEQQARKRWLRDADPDQLRRQTLGHADQAMTSHYTHIEAQAHRAAAEAVARLVEREP